MFMKKLIFRQTLMPHLFEFYDKFKGLNKLRAESNIWKTRITPKFCPRPKAIIESQCNGISKRYFSNNRIVSNLKNLENSQPELENLPLEKGNISVSHLEGKTQELDTETKIAVGEDVITALNKVYGLERQTALSMMRSKKFLHVDDSTILKTVYFLAKKKISVEQIQRIPWLLTYEHEILQGKMKMITGPKLFESIEDGLGFCYLSRNRIDDLQKFFHVEAKNFPNHQNRVYCLADILEVPVAHLTEKIVKPNRVMTMDFQRITDIIDIVKSYDVSNDDILRDLWIFFHNMGKTKERLKAITEVGCTRPRLWMCRCTDEVFEKTMKIHEDKKLILLDGSITLIEYLSEQLEWTPEQVKEHCRINPNLLRVRISKLKSMMEMLLSEGITREAIRAAPRVLHYSEAKLRSRIHRLKSLGYHPTSCPTLFQEHTKFETFCKKLEKHGVGNERTTEHMSTGTIMDP